MTWKVFECERVTLLVAVPPLKMIHFLKKLQRVLEMIYYEEMKMGKEKQEQ